MVELLELAFKLLELAFDGINGFITGAIIFVFVVAKGWVLRNIHQEISNPRDTILYSNAPSLMTSIGVFGTFLGIVLGLLDFDPENLENSTNTLIVGMKTAFVSSVVGMLAAISFKVIDAINNRSITTADEMASQVTDALQQMVESFNDGLMDKFGENFRQLNDAVIGLNDWIKEHEQNIKDSQNLLTQTAEHTQETMDRAEIMSDSLLQSQQMTERTLSSLEKLQQDIHANTLETKSIINDISNSITELRDAMTGLSGLEFQSFNEQVEEILQNMEMATNGLSESANKIENVPTIIEQSVKDASESMAKQLEASTNKTMDNLDKETERALQQLGNSLASISEQFANDYKPLANELKKVVEIAQSIKS